MANPVLVEVTRGGAVESRHRGAISVFDGDGNAVFECGDTALPVFPRSAIKSVQGLSLVESGAADAFGFGDKEISLACSSHSGEVEHVAMARSMLAAANLQETCLECGGHWSTRHHVLLQQTKIYDETPPAVCNNCSGKHAGFVCTAAHLDIDPTGYIAPEHPIQKMIKANCEDVFGKIDGAEICGTDGCSIPTYATPLKNMAVGFAKMATGKNMSEARAAAAKRLLNACMSEPFYMAGTKRFCTDFMTIGGGRLFAKTGAEGVFCGAIPELGLGIALKCDDGSARGSEVMMAKVVQKLLQPDDPLQEQLNAFVDKPLRNWNKMNVGNVTALTL